jgi:hypothetical protein
MFEAGEIPHTHRKGIVVFAKCPKKMWLGIHKEKSREPQVIHIKPQVEKRCGL